MRGFLVSLSLPLSASTCLSVGVHLTCTVGRYPGKNTRSCISMASRVSPRLPDRPEHHISCTWLYPRSQHPRVTWRPRPNSVWAGPATSRLFNFGASVPWSGCLGRGGLGGLQLTKTVGCPPTSLLEINRQPLVQRYLYFGACVVAKHYTEHRKVGL